MTELTQGLIVLQIEQAQKKVYIQWRRKLLISENTKQIPHTPPMEEEEDEKAKYSTNVKPDYRQRSKRSRYMCMKPKMELPTAMEAMGITINQTKSL